MSVQIVTINNTDVRPFNERTGIMDKLVKDAPEYNSEFPESYSWGLVDSIALSDIAISLARRVIDDLLTKDRNYVPGCRLALREIAFYAKVG